MFNFGIDKIVSHFKNSKDSRAWNQGNENRCTFYDYECEAAKCEESALNTICPILLDDKPSSAYGEHGPGARNEASSIYLLRNCRCQDYQIKPCRCKDYQIKPCGDHACTKKLPAVPYDIVYAILKRKMREMEKRRGRTAVGRTNKRCHICNNSLDIRPPGQFDGVCSYCAVQLRQALGSFNCQAVTAGRGLGGFGCFSKKKDPTAQQKASTAQQKDSTAQQKDLTAQRQGMTPQRKDLTPQQKDSREAFTPQRKDLPAQRQGMTPQRKDLPPQQKDSRDAFAPQRKDLPAQRQGMTPQRKDLPPQKKDSRDAFTPQRKDLPAQRQGMTPQRQGMTPQRKDLTPQKKASRESFTPQRIDSRAQRKDLYTQTGSITQPEDYTYQSQDLINQLQDSFCRPQEMTFQQPNVIVLQDRDNNSLIDHLMAVINHDAAPYNVQRYKDQDSRYYNDPPCTPCDYYDEEDEASLDISCDSIQYPHDPKSKSCICNCEACRKNDEVQKNLSALFTQALELFIQNATNTTNTTQQTKKKKPKKKPAGKAQSKPVSSAASNASSKKSSKNVSQSGSVDSIKTGKPKDQKDNTATSCTCNKPKTCCCATSSRNQNKYILPEVRKRRGSSSRQRNANGSTSQKETKRGSTNQNRFSLTKKPTQCPCAAGFKQTAKDSAGSNRQRLNSKKAAKGNDAYYRQSQNSNRSSSRQSQERAYGASPNSNKSCRCKSRRSGGQTDLSIQKSNTVLSPIAHYRPGMMQDMVNYLKAGNVCRRSVVRTAAGVTVHQKAYDIISQF